MKIKHYLCNAFIVENGKSKIAIDPGLDGWIFKLKSYIPKSEWDDVTHILLTHGDPDHHWSTDKIAAASGASVICGQELVRQNGEEIYMYNPRARGIQFNLLMDPAYPMKVGDVITVDGITFEAFRSVHGSLHFKFLFGLIEKTATPGPGERIGIGSKVFMITVDNKTIVNMGDSLLLLDDWQGLVDLQPDVLMIPIGGDHAPNTFNVSEALEVVAMMKPKLVIPCHYNVDFLFTKKFNPADDQKFKRDVEQMGFPCTIMNYGDELIV
ncbi:MAG: MBL fold metallo-hydrolase [Anaerolineales bacterium]|nr:MBL fold metallo-hydrolase [Chloroflexota bacterium]MBL6980378.1 MBL fold metallo-hydrolase [Anaerolineales bacterium]